MSDEAFVMNLLPAPAELIKEEYSTVVWTPLLFEGEQIVVKLYRHRGLWHAVRCWVTKYRAQREYERLLQLSLWDIPCTLPRGWTRGYSRDYGFYELLATLRIPDAIDLETYLSDGRDYDFRGIFVAVRGMHEGGFCHHALCTRNILIRGGQKKGRTFAFADVPRARIFPNSIVGTRMALSEVADLASDLIRLGVPRSSIPFDAYGLKPAESARVATMLDGYPQNKLLRLARDGESRIRHFFACTSNMLTGNRRIEPRWSKPKKLGIRSEQVHEST